MTTKALRVFLLSPTSLSSSAPRSASSRKGRVSDCVAVVSCFGEENQGGSSTVERQTMGSRK